MDWRKCLQVDRMGGSSRNPFFLDRDPITESNKGKRGISGGTLAAGWQLQIIRNSLFVQALPGNGLDADVKFVKTASSLRKPKHQ
jgi:hypothetical protein